MRATTAAGYASHLAHGPTTGSLPPTRRPLRLEQGGFESHYVHGFRVVDDAIVVPRSKLDIEVSPARLLGERSRQRLICPRNSIQAVKLVDRIRKVTTRAAFLQPR